MMTFDLPTSQNSIIKVIGVGGGGSNAVNHMFRQGIKGVDFIVCNTDQQALDISPVPTKIALGASLTKGRGAGSIPEVGRNAAIENIEEIKKILGNDTQMVFITAGMGGGTGTGAAPVIAQAAKEMGILTVGIVTIPFSFEGKKRKAQAEAGMEEMKKYVDTLLVICNEKLREIYGNLKLGEAFGHADDVLTTAAKGIAEIITTTMHINTDFADITTVMKESGVAIMGTGIAHGENRATKAVEQAMHSPLLNDSNIKGARYVLLNIVCGKEEITMDELGEVTDFIQESAGQTAEIIKGYGIDESLGENVKVTIIATGFSGKADVGVEVTKKVEKKIHILTPDEPKAKMVKPLDVVNVTPVVEPVLPLAKAVEPVLLPKTEEPVALTQKIKESIFSPVSKVEPVLPVAKGVEPVAKVVEPIAPLAKVEEPVVTPAKTFDVSTSLPKKEEVVASVPEIIPPVAVTPVASTPAAMENKVDEPEIKTEETVSNEPFLISKPLEAKVEEVKEEEKQVTIEFEITNKIVAEKTPSIVAETTPVADVKEEMSAEKIQEEEQKKKAQERILKLKELSFKLKTPNGIAELENEPAYKRRNVDLDSQAHSSESQVSRYTLSEGEDKKIEIKPNNSFLHDNVD